jgi:lipoyl(octanoyl) transferase
MDWRISTEPIDYPTAVAAMEAHVADMIASQAQGQVWLLEHPPTYTAGTSAKVDDLREARFPVYQTGRGGQYTYHGPGQRVAYVMLDLRGQYGQPDVRRYVHDLEQWIIDALGDLGVTGHRVPGRVGIWVDNGGGGLDKIAALGVRVRRGVAFHGVAVNVNPDLSHYSGIVPCGIADAGVTSLERLGNTAAMADLDAALKRHFIAIFGVPANFVAKHPKIMVS